MINYTPIDIGQSLDKSEILDNFTPHKGWNFWSFEKLTESKGGKYGKNNITEKAKNKYPKLCEYISHLPFTHISNVKKVTLIRLFYFSTRSFASSNERFAKKLLFLEFSTFSI